MVAVLIIGILGLFSANLLLDNKITNWILAKEEVKNEPQTQTKKSHEPKNEIQQSHEQRAQRIEALKEVGRELGGGK